HNLDLVGGSIALDCANSGDGPLPGGTPTERLRTYEDRLTFAERTELIGALRAADLRQQALGRRDAARAIVERARVLRDALQSIFSTVAGTGEPPEGDIEVLNGFLAEGMRHRRLERDERCCGWTWSAGDEPLSQMLWPIVNEAAELLVDGELDRLKTCGNESCAWLFLDLSRDRSRRWCDMKDCGNRAKARRHYARRKDAID